jgi:hypothetical protein
VFDVRQNILAVSAVFAHWLMCCQGTMRDRDRLDKQHFSERYFPERMKNTVSFKLR